MKKKVFACLLAALMLLSVVACAKPATTEPVVEATKEPVVTAAPTKEPTAAPTAEPTPEPEPEPKDIVILYTNDVHCGVDVSASCIGYEGVARIKSALEAAGKEVILVDCGDAIQGDVIGSFSKGENIIKIMNDLEYDVSGVGNHEFDYGMDQFMKNVADAKFTYVSCNFADKDGNPILDPYIILEKAGKKIAFVGVATPETYYTSTPTYFQNADRTEYIYSFSEGDNGQKLYDVVQSSVDAARAEGADYVVVLSHLGTDASSVPYTSSDLIVNTSGIDVVLDGHSHSVLEGNSVKNKEGKTVIQTSTGTKLANVGCLTITPEGKMSTMLINKGAVNFATMAGGLTDDAGVAEKIAAVKAGYKDAVSVVVAHTDVDLVVNDPTPDENGKPIRIVRRMETNLGDLCADAYRNLGKTDVAFVNGGGVRDTILKGDITLEQIIKVHPFGNVFTVVKTSGQHILDALEMGASRLPGENGGFLQVSGLKYTIDLNVDSHVVKNEKGEFVTVDGERRVKDVQILQADGSYLPIDPEGTYTLASHDYMLKNGGDGFVMFMKDEFVQLDSYVPDNEVLISFIRDALGGSVGSEYQKPFGQGRITIIDKTE